MALLVRLVYWLFARLGVTFGLLAWVGEFGVFSGLIVGFEFRWYFGCVGCLWSGFVVIVVIVGL